VNWMSSIFLSFFWYMPNQHLVVKETVVRS
jgi:hypothetical protein